MTMLKHITYMKRALALAARGKGLVQPNPTVGCVVVKGNSIVGEGYHRKFGGPHAEIEALKKAGRKSQGSTVYITLEPCSHHGKTPPCTNALINANVKHVIFSFKDPNPQVNGKGAQLLRKAGIKVTTGLLQKEAENLNRAFVTRFKKKRPYVILKTAMTLDGKIATKSGDSKWITSPNSRKLVHNLRAQSDAVLIGANTVVRDNPELTSHGKGKNPRRIILDPRFRTPKSSRILKDKKAQTLIITSPSSLRKASRQKKNKNVELISFKTNKHKFNNKNILRYLANNNVNQLFLEGGGETTWEFLKQGLVDEFLFFVAPKVIGGRNAPTPIEGEGWNQINKAKKVRNWTVENLNPDILIRGKF